MIIWGSRVRYKDLDQGEFNCPRCMGKRPYKRKMATRYFTLYFIPIFPMGKLGELVECQGCKTAYETSVLNVRVNQPRAPKSDEASMMNVIPQRIAKGDPLEYIVRDLTSGGLDLDVARGAVKGMAGSPIRTCPNCKLTYGHMSSTCQVCGRAVV